MLDHLIKTVASTVFVGGLLGAASCGCAPDKSPGNESAPPDDEDSSASDSSPDDVGEESSAGESSSGGGEPVDSEWATDAFHLVAPTHGEDARFVAIKIQLFPDGKTQQTTLRCDVEDLVTVGRWHATAKGIVVTPPPGEDQGNRTKKVNDFDPLGGRGEQGAVL